MYQVKSVFNFPRIKYRFESQVRPAHIFRLKVHDYDVMSTLNSNRDKIASGMNY